MHYQKQNLPSPPLTSDIKPKSFSQTISPTISGTVTDYISSSSKFRNTISRSSTFESVKFASEPDTDSDDLILSPLRLPPPLLNTSELPPPPIRQCRIIQAGSEPKKESKRKRAIKSPLETATRQKARKIAHSDIERRRRIKINEQFEILKSLVPACSIASANGENGLHKLVILQETVAFIKYLKTCLDTIQSPRSGINAPMEPSSPITGLDSSAKLKISNLLT